ncbi:MAG: 1,4-dihydroxy-2-naphthoate octaprenyltransferase, partial [Saprospiraceae bacterium]
MKSKTPYILLNQWKSRLLWNSSAISIGLFLILLFTVKAELVNLLSAIVVLSLCMWFVYKGYQSRVPNMTDALNLAHIQNAKLEYSSELLLEDRNIKG